jgi:hypothetical protein
MGWPSFKTSFEPKIKRWGIDANYGGSKVARITIPKVYINGNFSTIMKKNVIKKC